MPSSHIIPSGGLLTHQFVEAIQQPTFAHPALAPETFALPGRKSPAPAELERTIGSAWELLVERWDGVERDLPGMDISTLRDRWVRPLLSLLDFSLEYNRADLIVEGDLRFPLSHFAIPQGAAARVPFHSVLPAGADSAASLDARRDGNARRLGPHDLVQRYLNLTRDSLWGLVTDGLRLRLLRDYHHSYTRGYVEFDLQGIFSERDFAAFRALYRLCHASRFLAMPITEAALAKGKAAQSARRKAQEIEEEIESEEDATPAEEEELAPTNLTPLESFYQHALSTGVKVGEDLRGSVRAAIEGFGNGFLDATPGLTARIQSGEIPVAGYYDDILHVIYRILFLLFAEQRGMFPGRGSLFMEEYSLTALRTLAEHAGGEDHHTDLWERLKVTFRMVEQGVDALNVFGYNGMLFSPTKTPILAGDGEQEPVLRNDALLQVIKKLTTVERDRALQRISYADLSVEEIGSVYESLLDYTPRISTLAETVEEREIAPGMFYLDPRGKARKTSGSYYTHPALVNELIKSALLPVLADRLKAAVPTLDADHPELLNAEQRSAAETALLAMKVIDPAAGSGAFLIAADNTLALRLAQIRTGDLFPAEREIRKARRDVLANCLYAVDLNPMAIELCKLSLWINAVVEDEKLNFLDHHIRPGNSLVGAFRRLVAQGIPSEAYGGATGDDKDLAKALKKRNDAEKAGQLRVFRVMEARAVTPAEWAEVNRLAQSNPHAAEVRYHDLQARSSESGERLAFDLWTAAFFWPLESEGDGLSMTDRARAGITQRRGERQTPLPPTFQDIVQALAAPKLVDRYMADEARRFAQEMNFFHWELEFPEIFSEGGEGGFDVVLGNPPWEKYTILEKEFFTGKDQIVAETKTKAVREQALDAMKVRNPFLYQEWINANRDSFTKTKFVQSSGRFPLSAYGELNTYIPFTELGTNLLCFGGRSGMVVKSGIFSSDIAANLFDRIITDNQLISLYDFRNWKNLFPDIGFHERFSLITTSSKSQIQNKMMFAFLCDTADDIEKKSFELTKEDIQILSPNTGKLPVLPSETDKSLLLKVARNHPVLEKEGQGFNCWSVAYGSLFHASGASIHFQDKEKLSERRFELRDNMVFANNNEEVFVPFYEGKYIHQYDFRFSSFEGIPRNIRFGKKPKTHNPTFTQKSNPNYCVEPRYWIDRNIAKERIDDKISVPDYYCSARRVTNVISNARTIMSCVMPGLPANDMIVSLNFYNTTSRYEYAKKCLLFTSFLNSIPFDFIARLRVTENLLKGVLFELPVLSPDMLSGDNAQKIRIMGYILSRALELSYVSWMLYPLADDLWSGVSVTVKNILSEQWDENARVTGGGHANAKRPDWAEPERPDGFPRPPFKWDEERRAYLRAELDGLYAHLYGLTRDELSYILDTFPIVRRKDEAKFGEYRTKRLCMEAYDRLVGSDLIPAEARALQQHDVLKNGGTASGGLPAPAAPAPVVQAKAVVEPQPAPAPKAQPAAEKPQPRVEEPSQPVRPAKKEVPQAKQAAGKPQPSTSKREPAAGRSQPADTPQDQPMLTDLVLYKCLDCGRMVLGYDRANHARKDHKGVEPEWKKMGK